MSRRTALASALFWTLILAVFPAPARKACPFLSIDLSDSSRYGIFRYVVTDALAADLRQAELELVPPEAREAALKRAGMQDRDLLDKAVALRIAPELGANVALTGFLRAEEGRIQLYAMKSGPAGVDPWAGR